MKLKSVTFFPHSIALNIFIFTIAFLMICYIKYNQLNEHLRDVASETRELAITNSYSSDNLAEAISLTYHLNKDSYSCDLYIEQIADAKLWGVNLDVNQKNTRLTGTLQSTQRSNINCNVEKLIKIINDSYRLSYKQFAGNNNLMYFIPLSKKFIYFLSPVSYKDYVFNGSGNNILNDSLKTFDNLKAEQSINWGDSVRTGIHKDAISKTDTISVGSIIYDFDNTNKILGVLYTDYRSNSLKKIVTHFLTNSMRNGIQIKIIDKDTDQSLIFNAKNITILSVRKKLSDRFLLEYNVSLFFLLKECRYFILFYLVSILFLVISKYREVLKINRYKTISITDHLTKCFNKKHFDYHLSLIDNSRELKKCKMIIVCDCNNFKKINDSLGHDKGDQILKVTSKLLKQSFSRSKDMIFRIGGDEFVVICDSMEPAQAEIAMTLVNERIHNNVNASEFSISYGYSFFRDHINAKSAFIQADENQYIKKNQ